jgi:hypothetical protein
LAINSSPFPTARNSSDGICFYNYVLVSKTLSERNFCIAKHNGALSAALRASYFSFTINIVVYCCRCKKKEVEDHRFVPVLEMVPPSLTLCYLIFCRQRFHLGWGWGRSQFQRKHRKCGPLSMLFPQDFDY